MERYTQKYIQENILLDNNSFHETKSGKIEGKCLIDNIEIKVALPKTINKTNVIEAIQKNELTEAILERIAKNIQKELSKKENNNIGIHQLRTRVDDETYERISYWAKKRECSMNEYFNLALEHMIKWENQDYDLPTLEQQRLNQLINAINALTSDVRCLEHITTEGFKSLIGLTRGDNYLLDEDGDL